MTFMRRGIVSRLQWNLFNTRTVTSWSPVATAFNTAKQKEKLNFTFLKDKAGLLGVSELKDWSGFYILQENVHNEVDILLEEACSPTRARKMVTIFDEISDSICRVADVADFFKFSHPESRYRKAAEDCMVSLSGLIERLNTHVELFTALKSVQDHGDILHTDAIDQRVGDLFVFDFLQSGIHLEEKKREKVVEVNNSIIQLSNLFLQGTQKPVEISVDRIPSSLLTWLSDWRTGDKIIMRGSMSDHPNALVRESSYKIYLHPDKQQEALLQGLLSARNELANLVGYQTYADKAIKNSLGDTPENVMHYLTKLADKIKPKVEEDMLLIHKTKNHLGAISNDKRIMPWDFNYYMTVAKRKKFQIDSLAYAQYLSLGTCMDGLNNLFQSLYNVSLETVQSDHGELWNFDVHKLAVVHQEEGTLGYIYCDFFQRFGKPEQDCHFTLRGGRQLRDESYQLPVIVLMLNFRPPQDSIPTLLSPGMMENLFHEFGHAMHSMLGRTRYQHITGTRCHTDFAEVPSTLMEYFARDARVISTFARHYKTGETIPEYMLHQLCQSKNMFAAWEKQTTVFYSIVDQILHGNHPLNKNTTDILAEVQAAYYSIPLVPNTAWQLRFGHLVHYGAKYYSYSMAKAVASRIWQQCFKDDPFNRSMGERYRHEVLAHGGGKSPHDLVRAMLDEEPTTDLLVQSMVDELVESEC